MLNVGSRGGWGAGANTASPNPPPPGNPFTKPAPNPFAQNNQPKTQTQSNSPFETPVAAFNPFSAATTSSLNQSASPSAQRTTNETVAPRNPFGAVKPGTSAPSSQPSMSSTATVGQSPFGQTANAPRIGAGFVQPAWPTGPKVSNVPAAAPLDPKKRKGSLSSQGPKQNGRGQNAPSGLAGKRGPGSGFGSNTQPALSLGAPNTSSSGHDGRSQEFASKIQQQLSKDRIKPPPWPVDPGSHAQRQAMEAFRESYKAYREKARKSLIKAGLIDDPDQRRTLQQALDFRGISEDMCPEWEKITRITEYDVRNPEKAHDDTGDLVADPSLMVKRLARSAAGQDAPLPMDVRSFATLRKSLDYLIDDLIPDDSCLPSKHNFLWDRTRAIRIDLSVQKYNLTPNERADLVYCLETIARFHVTSLHLLSRDGFAAEDFSEQQEIEQLGKTLMSLKELYDDCVDQGIECANEAEFRGYYIVFNARNPSIKETVEGWGTRLWNSDGIRTAMCLVESLQNTWALHGPLNPYAPTEVALGAAAIFFSIVSSPQISYTMACFAEIHFNDVRKSMLQILRKSYTRPRDGPKDITPAFIQERLRFDTEGEAVDFAEKHGIVFGQDGAHRYAILNTRQSIEDPRVRHAFSLGIVEHKRSDRSLPDIIHHTVYQENANESGTTTESESLFFADTMETPADNSAGASLDSDTDSFDTTTASQSPVTINTQPTNTESHTSAKSVGATPSLFSSNPQSSAFVKPSAPTTPFANFAQPQASSSQTITSLPNQTNISGPNTNPGGIINSSGGSQPNAFISAQHPGGKGASASDHNTSTASNSTASPGFFTFLNKNNGSLPNPPSVAQSSPSLLFAPTKPALFSTSETREKALGSTAINTTSASPNLLGPPSTYNTAQFPAISNSRSLFQNLPSAPVSLGISSSVASSSLSAGPLIAPQARPTSSLAHGDTGDIFKTSQEASAATPTTPGASILTIETPTKDPMGDFIRWFVLADRGLQSDLEHFAVEHFLKSTWENFKAVEAKRIQEEEDERSWAEALKFRHHSLMVTFFYRWREITRKRRVIKRIRLEKEKARKWNSPQSIRERQIAEETRKEKDIREAKELMGKRTMEHTQENVKMRESTSSRQSLEDVLLATGVLRGVTDERTAAQHAVQDEDGESDSEILPTEKLRLRSENLRRRKRGLPPLKRFPEGKPHREGSKTAMLRAISTGAGRDSLSLSASSLRNSTFSSSYRSSLGYNDSRVAKHRSGVSDPYWRMRANGLVQMPNGEYLHESLALPMLREGKRFPGLGDYGLPPEESFTPSQSSPAGRNRIAEFDPPTPTRFGMHRISRSPSILDGAAQKRKRGEAEDEDLAAYRNEAPATQKRAKSGDRATPTAPSADQDFLDSIANLLNQVTAVTKSSSP